MSIKMSGIRHKSSSITVGCSFVEWQIPFGGTNSMVSSVQNTALSGSPHRSLDNLLLTFRGSEGISDVLLCTSTAEVVCHGHHFAHAQHTHVSGCATSAPTI